MKFGEKFGKAQESSLMSGCDLSHKSAEDGGKKLGVVLFWASISKDTGNMVLQMMCSLATPC